MITLFTQGYTALTPSPLWLLFLLCCQIRHLLRLRKKRPTWKVRLWQGTLIASLIVILFNLAYRVSPQAEKYLGAFFFMSIAVALFLWAYRRMGELTRRKADRVSLALALAWFAFSPVLIFVAGFFLFLGLSLLFILP